MLSSDPESSSGWQRIKSWMTISESLVWKRMFMFTWEGAFPFIDSRGINLKSGRLGWFQGASMYYKITTMCPFFFMLFRGCRGSFFDKFLFVFALAVCSRQRFEPFAACFSVRFAQRSADSFLALCFTQIKLKHNNYHLDLWHVNNKICTFAHRKPKRMK